MTSKHEFIDKYLADSEYALSLVEYINTQPLRKKVSDLALIGVMQRLLMRGMITEPEFPVITRASVVTDKVTNVKVTLQTNAEGATVEVVAPLPNWIDKLQKNNNHETLFKFANAAIIKLAEKYYV